jgi:hypothetical protein
MAEKPRSKPKSGGSLTRIFRYPSILMTVICALTLVGTQIYAANKRGELYEASVPQPAFDAWLADLSGFHSRKAGYPASLVELENEIWMPAREKSGQPAKSQLEHGPRMFLYGNYAYLYQRDKADASICSLWAIPQGARFKEGHTFYLLITPKSVTAWKGTAMTVDQMRAIPTAARPTGEQMAQLGMFKQSAVPETRKKKSFPFNLFN